MDAGFGALRDLVFSGNLAVHGFPVSVLLPGEIVTTRGIWLPALDEPQPYGSDLKRREPRRTLILPRLDVADVPRGTVIYAPDKLGDAEVLEWRADGYEVAAAEDHFRVFCVRATT